MKTVSKMTVIIDELFNSEARIKKRLLFEMLCLDSNIKNHNQPLIMISYKRIFREIPTYER